MRSLTLVSILVLVFLLACAPAPTSPPTPAPTSALPDIEGGTPEPEATPSVAEGFHLTIAHEGLNLPTTLATDGKYFYATEFQTGQVKRLTDTDGDGIFEGMTLFAEGFDAPRGIAIQPGTGDIFISSLGQINRLRDPDGDGVADTNDVIIDGLFVVDQSHANNSITFGPDGRLYIAAGFRRKQLDERADGMYFKETPVPDIAGKILSILPDGSDLQIFAGGFRNPFDLVFAPDGTLYVTDNGEDQKDGSPEGDELNLVERGGDYGFPQYLGDPPPDSGTVAPLISFPGGTSPDGLIWYAGENFPPLYRDNLFIALFSDPRKVVRAWRDANGKWQYEDFVTGLNRPVDLILGADGALYIADMNSGKGYRGADATGPSLIYRVEYVGP